MVFFSVVVTVFNKENYIYKTLQSVCNQRFTDFELLVINDGSTDGSLTEIEKIQHPNLRVINTKNQGVSAARNTGIENSKGSYIALLDGDDIWHPNHLETFVKAIKKYPDEFVFSNASQCLCEGKLKKYRYAVGSENPSVYNYFEASTISSIINSSSIAFKRSLYDVVGGFNTAYSNYEDIGYWFRIGLKYPVVFTNEITVTINSVENSLSKNKSSLTSYYFFEEYDELNVNNPAFRKVLDMNLCSLALLCKDLNFNKEYITLRHKINPRHINLHNKLLLYTPKPFDGVFKWLKSFF